ncbi:MAG: bifunctional UDP-N-acetylmuramoyl-tripeptide:D-alanyl-D-alanine ligase/alanine racemase [Bacteroidales bacterium]|jgi:alanine racemase|nr:bifunctional UDP-N-acetylmuramoyl-tripeptide:D-alanyl-D-alanine ligase/alanine racemase [Bacteroidales bacterium]
MINIAQIITLLDIDEKIVYNKEASITNLCFDSRELVEAPHTIFFAIKTQNDDGHRFIPELVEKGVRHFIITRPVEGYAAFKNCNFLRVNNTIQALQTIASFHRQAFHIPVVGITGSNGKTIVKEWLFRMLSGHDDIVKNPMSYNSQIGVPLSIWQINEKNTLAIFEAGISKPFEMQKLVHVIQPTLGIFTNIGRAHSRFFVNEQQKLDEKLQLFENVEALVYCRDHQNVHETLQSDRFKNVKLISWGKNKNAVYHIMREEKQDRWNHVFLNDIKISIPFTDTASVENALHTVVMALYLGISVEEINQKLALLTPLPSRMEIMEGIHHSLVINDTYSLDMNALEVALSFLRTQCHHRKKSLLISDFDHVNTLQIEDYEKINQWIRQSNIYRLIAVGDDFFQHQDCFQVKESYFFKNTDDLLQNINKIPIYEEAILVKGARKFHLDKVANSLHERTHRTVLQINLSAIIHNLNVFRSFLRPGTRIIAMVKANCYGLGSNTELIHELLFHKIDFLAVAYTDEGIYLREKGIKVPIIVLGAEGHSFDSMVRYGLEPEIYNFHYLNHLETLLSRYPDIRTFPIHLKFDTGMHRLGFDPDDIIDLVSKLKNHPVLKVSSIFSHLSASEDRASDPYTLKQIALFSDLSAKMMEGLGYFIPRHILNSSGIARFPEYQFEMVRLGLGLYGFSPLPDIQDMLQNVVTLKTVITQIKSINSGEPVGYNRTFIADKKMQLAIIPLGYADGYPLTFSNGIGKVFVGGETRPIVGRISMDMSVIDVSNLQVRVGDEVIVYGDTIPMNQAANTIQTIPYQLLTAISKRVPRMYIVE